MNSMCDKCRVCGNVLKPNEQYVKFKPFGSKYHWSCYREVTK